MYNGVVRTLDDFDRAMMNDAGVSGRDRQRLLGISRKSRAAHTLRYGHWLLSEERVVDAWQAMRAALVLDRLSPRMWWGIVKAGMRRGAG
jgi:hypothetical protein